MFIDNETSLLVVGGGVAGLLAAIEAAGCGVRVVLMDRGKVGRSGSSFTAGGVFAAPLGHIDSHGSPILDSADLFYEDILTGGGRLGHRGLIRKMAAEAVQCVETVERMGVQFQRSAEGRMIQVRMLGHSRARSCEPLGGGGAVVRALREAALKRGVQFMEWTAMAAILTRDGAVVGVLAFPVRGGIPVVMCTRAVIIAAGGATGLFPARSASFPTWGVGPVAALDAGAFLANLEFLEFSLVPAPGGTPLATGGINPFLGRGARLFNARGDRIMEKVDPKRLERTDRSLLVETVARECREGRGPVVMDPTSIPAEEFQRWQSMRPHCLASMRDRGVNPARDLVPWVVAIHSSLGGIVADERGATGVPGLYAAGESATGFHGSNRLGSNALTACAVLGSEAGRSAASFALERNADNLARGAREAAEQFVSRCRRGKLPAREYLRLVREAAERGLSIPRNKEGLEKARASLSDLAANPPALDGPEGAAQAVECRALAHIGFLTAEAALRRTETRGQHVREDYAHQDAALERWFVAAKEGKEVRWTDMPVPGKENE